MRKRLKKITDSQENDSPYVQEQSKNYGEFNLGSKQFQGNMLEKKRNRYIQHKQGKWRRQQDEIYVRFILQNRCKLASKAIRRSTRIFRRLAQQLGFQRTPEQCRMHHQRMKRKSRGRSITAIAKFIQKKYKIKFDKLTNNKNIKIPKDQNILAIEGIQKKEGIATQGDSSQNFSIDIVKNPQFGIKISIMIDRIHMW